MQNEIILFVDDEPEILKALERELFAWSKTRKVKLALRATPESAVQYAEETDDEIAVIVSDLKMPGMDGIELLQKMNALRPEAYTLILSGYSDIDQMIQSIERGVSAFILKPWESSKLKKEIEKALSGYRMQKDYSAYVHLLNDELKWAGELQKQLLQSEIPASPKLDFSVTYNPLPNLHCGGDYYDIIPFGEDRFIILIGDVAGHGVKAAFITTILKTMIYRGYIRERVGGEFSPADFLGWLNSRICKQLQDFPDMLVTFFAALVDLPQRRIHYSNAGHFPFFLIHADGSWDKCGVKGTGMGFRPELSYEEEQRTIESEDTAVFFTDGLLEHPLSDYPLTLDQLGDVMAEHIQLPDTHQKIIDTVKRRMNTSELYDDVTLLSFRVKAVAPA